MVQEMIEKRFEVGSPARMKLSNIRGSVNIQAGEDGVIEVTAVKHLNSGSQDQTEIKIEQVEDGRVIIKTDYTSSISNWFGFNKPCRVDYTVRLPKNCEVRVRGVSCEISAQGLNGEIDINTVSGDLALSDLSGQIKIGAVSGAIRAQKLCGELETNSVSGQVRVMDSQLSKASVQTVSGSIVVQSPLTEGPYILKSVSGNATLIVPGNTACSASFHSVSGRMRTSLLITRDNRHGSRGSIEIRGGGVNVSFNSVSGIIRILTAEDEKIVEQKATIEAPASPRNRLDVLQKIERGEISVEDALKDLNT